MLKTPHSSQFLYSGLYTWGDVGDLISKQAEDRFFDQCYEEYIFNKNKIKGTKPCWKGDDQPFSDDNIESDKITLVPGSQTVKDLPADGKLRIKYV